MNAAEQLKSGLTQAQVEFLQSKLGSIPHPTCEGAKFGFGSTTDLGMSRFCNVSDILKPRDPIMPCITLVCTRCGEVKIFSAVVLGLIDPTTGKSTV